MRKDYTGITFGYLTALQYHSFKDGKTYWFFRCICGKEILKKTGEVCRNTGRPTRSCGCKKKEAVSKAKTLPNNQAVLNKAYYAHLSTAKQRRIESKLTKEQYGFIASKPCFYCGEISLRSRRRGKDSVPMNSVDRLNNELFYDLSNSVPACFIFQKIKREFKESDFLNQIAKIARYRGMINATNP